MDNVSARFNLAMTLSGDNSDVATSELGIATDQLSLARGAALANGAGANQANVEYHDIVAVPTGAGGITLAINDTSLKDAFGVGLEIDKLKAIYVKNNTGGIVTLGAAAANQLAIFGTPATHTLILRPGGEFLWTAPDADGLAVDGTKDELKIKHDQAGTQNVDLIIAGVRVA